MAHNTPGYMAWMARTAKSITNKTELSSARSGCRTCFSGTWCCHHARYRHLSDTDVRDVVCVCGGGCRTGDFVDD